MRGCAGWAILYVLLYRHVQSKPQVWISSQD